ncbi:MAG TPA: ABC transporter substrate-binding protein [Candidatus Latescibacteria bacterium]|nr:ABC transporter substrate-binding protein [Candidatus Latescibacterota bacterium]
MKKTALSVVLLAILVLLPSCRRKEDSSAAGAPKPYVVGIFQSVDSPTANEVRRGILQAFADAGLRDGKEVVVTIRIANNDISEVQRIARQLVAERVDMIIPMSTQALQAAILASRTTPIVFSAVAVPYLVGAGRSADDHLGNVTGVASTGPIRQTMALIREVLPEARRVGSLWTPSEINSEYYLDLARESAAELGFEMIALPVTGPHAIQGLVQGLLNEKVDVLFPMSDNTINSSFDVIGQAAEENGLPLFGSFLRSVEFGACAALGFDFYDMGTKTGLIAVRVKNGESPARIPIQSMDEVRLFINTEAAGKQGVSFSKGLLDRVNKVVRVALGPSKGPGSVID